MEKGKCPNVSVRFLSIACCHCQNPTCVYACPVNAITKREKDGVVIVDQGVCLGGKRCGFACREACPYDAPQFDAEEDAKMQKCNFCIDRLEENKKPMCVEACMTKALDAGPMEQLKTNYKEISEAEGFVYLPGLKPSVLFKPKFHAKVGND